MKNQAPQYIHYMYSYPHKTAYRTFDNPVNLPAYLEKVAGKKTSLYFHIPFCRYKCGFCNLFSQQGYDKVNVDAYLDTMYRQALQLSQWAENLIFDAFSIGGGTPLILTAGQLDRLFEIAALFGVYPEKVFTSIETSPDCTDRNVLQLLKDRGVKRLSIGIQSFRPEELIHIKRKTSFCTIKEALDVIRQINFPQFNMDLIYGIEGQTVASFLYSIEMALEYNPTELFLYPLYVRNGVRISAKAGNETLFAMYNAGRDALLRQGFKQTSMRRFVKGDTTDLEYSCGDEIMLSCGCGGRSYIGNLHYATYYAVNQQEIKAVIDDYIQTADFTKIIHGYLLSEEEVQRRYIIKNLMYYRGIDKSDYRQRFGDDLPVSYFDRFITEGIIEDKDGFIRLTSDGMAYSDDIGHLFISPSVRRHMDNYKKTKRFF
ncbi:MAG: STM4012 family radical SAM protein [Tannerellaceae bacterium]|nr:STM4012 family radical SAM protein [Tannerellaceae bacterium]